MISDHTFKKTHHYEFPLTETRKHIRGGISNFEVNRLLTKTKLSIMGWSYRKRIKVIPGVHLNISKSGVSTTIGKRGASVNFSSSGTRVNNKNTFVKILSKLF